MDPTLIVVIVVVVVPVLVVGGLAYSARLRGPETPPESRRRVEALVTEAVPEEPEPDPGPREPLDR